MARLKLDRWRCWWERPYGHVDELLDYVDGLSGRWAARIRCVRCGREAALPVGDRTHVASHQKNPMTLFVPRQAGRALPLPKRVGLGPPPRLESGVALELEDGRRVLVRAVEATLSFGRRRTLYLAGAETTRPVVSAELRSALGRACAGADDAWLDATARQLEPELISGS